MVKDKIKLDEKECNKILRLIEDSWMSGTVTSGDSELYDKIYNHRKTLTKEERVWILTDICNSAVI